MQILNKKLPNIIFRVDSSSIIGTGHLIRTLTLANELKEHFNIIYITKELIGNRDYLIEQNGFKKVTLKRSFLETVEKYKPILIIIDHYQISLEEETLINEKYKLLVFDDEYKKHQCNILLNHSIISTQEQYSKLVNKNTKVLTGSYYTLLSDKFLGHKYKKSSILKVLITLGGSDPLNLSEKVLKALNSNVTIVTTSANPKASYLKRKYPNTIINCSDMASLILKFDLVITSASTSLLEVIALKKPFIAIQTATNQRSTVDILSTENFKNFINNFNAAKLKRAVIFCKIEQKKIEKFLNSYTFHKANVAKEIISEFK
ncbi:MAG: UDP-2,4-diacetamido-2,4,6-trideoxy-beta-L-altropyranose hydrolase [Helicobacteraceae bacterium]|nr:UDP-2,4-diacetamido-2,4,6-trideoxy-beta-L-altropyranose hydrolase [Helicobacteraceae bacterium]